MKQRRQEQARHHKGTSYDIIPMGASVLYYDHNVSQWLPGIVVERIHERQYGIVSEKGRKLSRNRQDIKMNPNEVKVQFTLPKLPLGNLPTIGNKIPSVPQQTIPKSSVSSNGSNRHTHGNQPASSSQSTKYSHQPNKSASLQDSTLELKGLQEYTTSKWKTEPISSKRCRFTGEIGSFY